VDFIANGKKEEKNEVAMFRKGRGLAIPRQAMRAGPVQAAQAESEMSGNCQKFVNANLQLKFPFIPKR
jgi:hypothetical protein